MGENSAVEIDAWLRAGNLVVAASERAARSLTAAFHRVRRAEGLSAWPSPNIQDYQTFIRISFNQLSFDGRFVLNSLQEQSLWAAIIAAAAPQAAQLAGARDRLSSLAMQAHSLLCAYAPDLLNPKMRGAWDQDAAAFSTWLSAFDETCRRGNMISAARLPVAFLAALEADSSARPPLSLAGFDRILPMQRELFTAWGQCTQVALGETAKRIEFHRAADPSSELAACALWCRQQLAANPHARLLVVSQDVPKRRGEIERAFLRFARPDQRVPNSPNLFEFSLGVPLSQIALVRSATLLLHWLNGSIDEHELDWLFFTGHCAAFAGESRALTAFMRAIRHRGMQRTCWTLEEFTRQKPGQLLPPADWVSRLLRTQHRLHDFAHRPRTPIEWAELVPQLLQEAGWPGARPLLSAEFQALRRWQQTIDDCASLGFDGRRIPWSEFLAALDRVVSETLFAPESEDAPILVAGPAESAGLAADAIWYLGADEDSWPASGASHPLLPISVQRQAGMPHAIAQLDWDLAAAITRRLLASATEIHFSYARQSDGVDLRPSRLVAQIAGLPQPLPSALIAPPIPDPLTVDFADAAQLPFSPGNIAGGSRVLTYQSQCQFKAFAAARLAAEDWKPAEAALTPVERGQLLHDVLHSVWAGPPNGIRAHPDLTAIPDLTAFVAGHVRRVLQAKMPPRARDSMPQRYLDLEEERLINLVTEWLCYESARVPFTVVETEQNTPAAVGGLALHLRLDRIDRLNDGSLLVIDYKSGDVSPKSWDLPRPDDVQLPLYAGFALKPSEDLGGLVFAKVRPGKPEFAGQVRNAKATLRSDLRANTNLVKVPLTEEQLVDWRNCIIELCQDFLAGRASVNPRDYPDTCNRCGLQLLCRIQDQQDQLGAEEHSASGTGANE